MHSYTVQLLHLQSCDTTVAARKTEYRRRYQCPSHMKDAISPTLAVTDAGARSPTLFYTLAIMGHP